MEEYWERHTDAPQSVEGLMLYEIVHELYDEHIFNIILTPNHDRAHRRWLHMDLTPGQHSLD